RKAMQDRAVIHRKAEPAHATLYCTTVDISPEGLQLKLKQALAAGERIELVVHVSNHPGSFRLRGETRWCTPARLDKSYLLGIELTGLEGPDYEDWRNLFI